MFRVRLIIHACLYLSVGACIRLEWFDASCIRTKIYTGIHTFGICTHMPRCCRCEHTSLATLAAPIRDMQIDINIYTYYASIYTSTPFVLTLLATHTASYSNRHHHKSSESVPPLSISMFVPGSSSRSGKMLHA